MLEVLPFVVFGVAFLGLILWMARRGRASDAARKERLQALGFAPCPDEVAFLAKTVTRLENNTEYRYSVEKPYRASLRGRHAYYYSKFRHRRGHITGADELLVPLHRPSSAGVMLFVKPTGVAAGTATKLIGAVATGAWDSQPDDLEKLDIPIDLQQTNLIGALGPSGASLYDLIDPATLSAFQQVGDHGALVVMCRGEWCSLAAASLRMPLDLDKLWPLVSGLGK
jgi:hypothetical protein